MKNKKLKWYFHIHHDILVEPLTEPIKNRIKFIKENKPKDEIKLRLKLMKPVKGKLPKKFIEARQKYDEERQKLNEVCQKYNLQALALHKKECHNCPWKNGSIFPNKRMP